MPARELELLESFLDPLGKVLTKEEVATTWRASMTGPERGSLSRCLFRLRCASVGGTYLLFGLSCA
jgi:DNA-binding winged helix-turn-helix (wHTH) protein